MQVRMLTVDEVDAYLQHLVAIDRESGADGAPHFSPYGRTETLDTDAARPREMERWTTPLTDPGWRRAWGLYHDDGAIVGHLYLAGGGLASEMHRVELGMGVRRAHWRRGGGRRLLATGIDWTRAQPSITWIDLGVFDENEAAVALYLDQGFVRRGQTVDRYRVDGHRIDETAMSLYVASSPSDA